ncbi:MAG: hypothetical protein GX272_00490 [Epulopiscium sp.]|nr:hypothetical protein [Candidatus Epulonipiscium sp.]
MKKLQVLKLTDATGREDSYHSKQFEFLLDGKHISETNYFLTDNNYIVDIDKDIDTNSANVKKAIAEGAVLTTMYYVDDENYSSHIYDFDVEGFWNGVEYGDDHGIIFKLKDDGENYERYVSSIEEDEENNNY